MINTPKIIAFHLPQYHSFPENDEWWGKGFTDWVNVKKARPLFKGHYQPRVPLNKNYYNMMDYETRKWQAETAQKYGVDGFCYYHYWFNGKLLMEKPLEALLKEKEIALPFCLCWANEPWTRAWDGGVNDVIMPQHYGDKIDWDNHIDYLLRFFKDERYIKIDNRPMLVLYRANNVDKCEEMICYWDNVCKQHGFNGIYIVEERNSFQYSACLQNSCAVLDFEPLYHKKLVYERCFWRNKIRKIIPRYVKKIPHMMFFYDYCWKHIIMDVTKKVGDKEHFIGAFVGWDSSPRKNRNGQICLGDSSPKAFGRYFHQLYDKAKEKDVDFIFINAWNEWAEGTYLEPDERYGYGYLEEIKKALSGDKNEHK